MSRTRALMLFAGAWTGLGCSSPARTSPAGDGGSPHDAATSNFTGRGPALVGLTISSRTSRTAPITLVPAFSPTTHDYYVACGEGTNEFNVWMSASTGSTSSLILPDHSGETTVSQTVTVSVSEDAAIVAAAKDATDTVEYWIRCLPHDFPSLQMTRHTTAGTPPAGYYLLGPATLPTNRASYAMILNGDGVPVWYVKTPGTGVYDVDAVVPGGVSFLTESTGRPFEIHDLATGAMTEVGSSDGHELRRLPNGHFITIYSPPETADLTGLSSPLADGGVVEYGPGSTFYTCQVVEVDATGTVVWKWDATDHFDPVKVMTFPQPAAAGTGGAPVAVPFHCNSVDVDRNGNLLVSARNMDSIFYIEKATGKVLWKMGGARSSKDGATYVPLENPFYRQHDARLQPSWKATCGGGTGEISVFDDETDRQVPSRAAVYDVRVTLGDAGAGCSETHRGASSALLVWQYRGAVNTGGTGSFRILADGSRTIGWGSVVGTVFSEVDLMGNDLADFTFPEGVSSYRVIKVPLSTFPIDLLRRTAGKR